MKRIALPYLILIIGFCLLPGFKASAVTTVYYYQGGDPAVRTNWNSILGGGGSNPNNFTGANQEFNFRKNGALVSCPAGNWTQNWTVSGAGSGVTIGDGGTNAFTLTIPAGFRLTGNVSRIDALGYLLIQNNTLPTLTSGAFDANSTIEFANSASTTIPYTNGAANAGTYGNLTISGTGGTYTFGAAAGSGTTFTVAGTLNITTASNVKLFGGNTGNNSYSITVNNYTQTNGTVGSGGTNNATDPGGNAPGIGAYIYITGTFNKTGGSLIDDSPNQITQIIFNGGGTQNFSIAPVTAGSNEWFGYRLSNNTTLTMNTSLDIDGGWTGTTQAHYLIIDVGSTLTAGTNLITTNNPGSRSYYDINGTFQTAATAGFSGGAATSITSTNAPTITLGTSSTVEYNATAAQTITTRTDYANVAITNNSIKTAVGANTLSANLTINNTATFAAGNFTHNIAGNFINNTGGTFTANNSTMNFNGTTGQTIGPAGGTISTFYILKVNDAANVTLLQDENISNTLTLSAGLLNTSAAGSGLLVMQNGSVAPALTDASTSFVNGPMQYQIVTAANGSTSVNFPIGSNTGSTDCRPLVLTVSHKTTVQYNYTAQANNAAASFLAYTLPATVDTVSGVHYWTINRTDAGGTSQPNLDLNGNQTIKIYFGTNDFVYEGSELTIVKNTSAASTTWFDIGGTTLNSGGGAWVNSGAPQAGSITSTSAPSTFTSFSTFTLGSLLAGWNSLPVELLNFSAVLNKGKVDLNWSTRTEVNNRYFTIERSADGINFSNYLTQNTKAPGGNSTVKLDYLKTDESPLAGTSYYRLKQTDNNGKNKTFNIVSVSALQNGVTFIVRPNPNQGQFTVDFRGVENNHEVQVVLNDEHGKQVYANSFYSQDIINSVDIVPSSKIGAGVYFCSLVVEGVKYTVKVIVN